MQRPPVDRDGHLRRHAARDVQLDVHRMRGKSQQVRHFPQVGVLGVGDDIVGPGGDCQRPQVHLVRGDDRPIPLTASIRAQFTM
jgi:hypothetical protein